MKTLQIPAEGILKSNDWGNSKVYRINCECGDSNHDHNVWVESDETGVTVSIYTTVKTNFWSKTRWHHIWQILTKGYLDTESTVILKEQQTYNYAHTLLMAMEDVQQFEQDRKARASKESI